MNGLTKLTGSYKAIAFLGVLIILGVMVGLGKMPASDLLEFVKYGFPSLVAARAYEEAAKAKVAP